MHDHDHNGETTSKAGPLKMCFGEFLGHLSQCALERRLGLEDAELFTRGELDTDKYIPPKPSDTYTFDDLKADDISSFTIIKNN